MFRHILSKITGNKKQRKIGADFFDLSPAEKEKIIRKATKLSSKDQQDLLNEYERRFGELKTHS